MILGLNPQISIYIEKCEFGSRQNNIELRNLRALRATSLCRVWCGNLVAPEFIEDIWIIFLLMAKTKKLDA